MTATQERPPTPVTPPVQPARKRTRPFPLDIYQSAVGKKWVMALSGIAFLGFLFAHMIGNLKMFIGAEDFNHYAEFLRELGYPILPKNVALWLMRTGLIVALAVHLHAAYSLTMMNNRARPRSMKYSQRHYAAANYASLTMRLSGIWILAFIAYHLADLTFGWVNPDFEDGHVYHNVVESFSNPIVAAFYVVSMVVLAVHIFHGAWSMFQSLGINNPKFNGARRGFAVLCAVVICGANISFPIAVQAGIVG